MMLRPHQREILRRFSEPIITRTPFTMTRRPLVFAFAVFTAAAQGADVTRRPWRARPVGSRSFVSDSYEHLFRGGSDAEEHPRSLIEAYDTSACSVQGGRAYMEDEYCVKRNGSFAAVFDGHGGNAVSRYLRQNLYANVQAAAPASSVQECTDALQAALKKVDKEVQRISHWSFQGSTAVACWVVSPPDEEPKRTVIAANVGDSRAVMSRNGVAVDLTLDHKPNIESEKARVEALGGKVVWCGVVDDEGKPVPNAGIYRVNGNLALSRAIGDRSERPAVTSKPDLTTYAIEDDDEFIVLASDGLWDVMSSQDAVAFVHHTLQSSNPVLENTGECRKTRAIDTLIPILFSSDISTLHLDDNESESDLSPASILRNKMADLLVAEALKRGSTDNVTVVVMWLKGKIE